MEKLFENIVGQAIDQGVTDLHFKSLFTSQIEQRIRGQLLPYRNLPKDTYQKFISYLLYRANIDMNHHLMPQTGSFQWQRNDRCYYFRLSYLPSTNDMHLVLRLLNHEKKIVFDKLSQDERTIHLLRKLIKKEWGMIVVSGPTGSGKSTTLHAFLDEIASKFHKNLISIEDPIEIYHSDMVQIQINESQNMTYQNALNQVLRHDPDVIMIGEIRDENTASIALRLALTGHLVLTTLHAGTVQSTLSRLENLGMTRMDLEEVLIGIISQRLVYPSKYIDPVCFFEIAAFEDLKILLKQNLKKYISLSDKLLEGVQKGWVTYEEIENLLET